MPINLTTSFKLEGVAGERYKIIRSYSYGKDLNVYKAHEANNPRVHYVIKSFNTNDAFERESRALRELIGAKNIMQMIDSYPSQEIIICECALYDLATFLGHQDYIQRNEEKANIIQDIVSGLSELHKRNIVHTELSPKNVMYFQDKDGYSEIWKLIDFDTACFADKDYVKITMNYSAPEVIKAHEKGSEIKANFAMDMFSFGLILYFLETGRHYWDGKNEEIKEEIISAKFLQLHDIRDHVACCAIRLLLSKNPTNRMKLERFKRSDYYISLSENESNNTNLEEIVDINNYQYEMNDTEFQIYQTKLTEKTFQEFLEKFNYEMKQSLKEMNDKIDNCTRTIEDLSELTKKIPQWLIKVRNEKVPRVFVMVPDSKDWKRPATWFCSKPFRLLFVCEHKGNWHIPDQEGYKVIRVSQFIKKYGPWINLCLQTLSSLLGIMTSNVIPKAVSEILSSVFNIADNSDIMRYFQEIIDTVDIGVNNITDEEPNFLPLSNESHIPHQIINSSGLRELEKFLDTQESADHFGGLVQCVDKETQEILWLCDEHKDAYSEQVKSPPSPLDSSQSSLISTNENSQSRPNSFESQPPQNSFGSQPPQNSFGSQPPQNSFGSQPPQNSFGSQPPPNSFGSQPPPNSFGSQPPPNSFGSQPPPNSFGSQPPPNSFGSQPPPNSFGSQPPPNSFGSQPPPNSFGSQPPPISFGPHSFAPPNSFESSQSAPISFGSQLFDESPNYNSAKFSRGVKTRPILSNAITKSDSLESSTSSEKYSPSSSPPSSPSSPIDICLTDNPTDNNPNAPKWSYSKFDKTNLADPLDPYYALEYVCTILGELVVNAIESDRMHFRKDDLKKIAHELDEYLNSFKSLSPYWYDRAQKFKFISILKNQVRLYMHFLISVVRYCDASFVKKLSMFSRDKNEIYSIIKAGESFNNHLSKLILAMEVSKFNSHRIHEIKEELDKFADEQDLKVNIDDSSIIVKYEALSRWYRAGDRIHINDVESPYTETQGGVLFETSKQLLDKSTIVTGKSLKDLTNNFLCVMKEIYLYSKLSNNDYVIKFRGYKIHNYKATLFYDYAVYGDLYKYFQVYHNSPKNLLKDWNEKIKLAWEISHGVKYLHDKKIVHLDLRSANILLKYDETEKTLKPKISNFLWSRYLYADRNWVYPKIPTTAVSSEEEVWKRWYDPDRLRIKDFEFLPSSDIYSLGLLFWEIACCEEKNLPFKEVPVKELYHHLQNNHYEKLPEIPEEYRHWELLISKMWQSKPDNRCKMIDVVTNMQNLYEFISQ